MKPGPGESHINKVSTIKYLHGNSWEKNHQCVEGCVLELMIPPITGWVVQWENALLELGKSRVRSPVWPYLFSSYSAGAEEHIVTRCSMTESGKECELSIIRAGKRILIDMAAGCTWGATGIAD